MSLPGRRNLRQAIREHGGLVADVARHFNTTRQTIYNWLDHYDMRDEISKSRTSMRQVAGDVIYQRLMSENMDYSYDAAKFVMLHLKDDGSLLSFSPEVLRYLAMQGMSVSDAVAEFEAMIREEIEKSQEKAAIERNK